MTYSFWIELCLEFATVNKIMANMFRELLRFHNDTDEAIACTTHTDKTCTLKVNVESLLSHWLQSHGMFDRPDVNLTLLLQRTLTGCFNVELDLLLTILIFGTERSKSNAYLRLVWSEVWFHNNLVSPDCWVDSFWQNRSIPPAKAEPFAFNLRS